MDISIAILIVFISIYVMRKCSSSFDIAANFLTRNMGEGIKGPTINAVASSLPELLISSMFLFFFKDIKGFSAGFATIIGSSAFNIAFIPVISYIYVYITKDKNVIFKINKLIVNYYFITRFFYRGKFIFIYCSNIILFIICFFSINYKI